MRSARHYPFATRMLIDLFNVGSLPDVSTVEVEEEYGYAARIVYHSGAVRIIKGSDVGLNRGAATDVAKDKQYTKTFLQNAGFVCPRGSAFLLPWWAARIRPRLRSRGMATLRESSIAPGYASDVLGFPVFVKPVDGSKGYGVWRCETAREVQTVLDRYESERTKVAIVEEAVNFPDFRFVILSGKLISAYQRLPLSVRGDGKRTVSQLLIGLQERFDAEGRDTRIDFDDQRILARLQRGGIRMETILLLDQQIQLLDASNLSSGGTAEDVTENVSRRWARLAAEVAGHMGLAFCGVDIACADPTVDEGDYYILEVNGTPGLDHYGGIGSQQQQIVRDLYASVFNLAPD